MRTRISIRKAKTFSFVEIQELSLISMLNRGCMMYDVQSNWRNDKAYIVRLLNENNEVVSWALTYPYSAVSDKIEFQVYTQPKYRQKGYGSRVFKAAVKKYGLSKLVTHPHDYKSTRFFKKNRMEALENV